MSKINYEVSIKNINSLFQSVRELTERSFEQQNRIDQLMNTVGTMGNQIAGITALMYQHKASITGHRATER